MPFRDEHRVTQGIAGAKRAKYLKDVDAFISNYERLEGEFKDNDLRLRSLERALKAERVRVTKLSTERNALAQENKRLKTTLDALRNSWRYRVGTAAIAPGRAVGRLNRLVFTNPKSAASSGPGSGKGEGVQRPASHSTHPVAETTTPTQRYDQLAAEVGAGPTKNNVYNLVAHGYFTLGKVAESAEVIRQHGDVLVDLEPKEQRLINAVNGIDRLMGEPPVIPPRQGNAGYQAESGRMLYCVHSTAPYNTNGYSTRTAGLAKALSAVGVDLVVAARPGYPWDVKTDIAPHSENSYDQLIDDVPHFFSSGPSWTSEPLDHYFQRSADSYVAVAMRNRVEHIQAASNYVTALPALIAARRLGLPFVYEVRGLWEITEASGRPGWESSDRYLFAKRMETLVASAADQVLAITSQVRDELVARGIPAEKIRLLPNAVDTDEISDMPPHQPSRERLGLNRETPVIGYAGSIVDYEGLETLLDAVHLLALKGAEFKTVIVGDGPSLPALKAHAKRLQLEDLVVFTGRVSSTEVPLYLSLFDIMPCPRLSQPVTQMVSPLKPLEGMAAAKAVVLSDLAPLRDLAGPGEERARLFTAGDAGALADVLSDLLRHPEKRRTLGRRARLWAVGERTWRKLALEIAATHAGREEKYVPGERELRDVTIGIIADEFTTAGLAPEATLLKLDPASWHDQLQSVEIDALFVESAWEGNEGAWRGKVGYYDRESFADLSNLLTHCRARSIPTIFWNKEDPVHYNRFAETAKHFEYVFTSDDNSIPKYLEHAGPYQRSVASLPFYAQPLLHNPLPGQRSHSRTACYAGSYYGDRFEKRSADLHTLLSAAISSGLTIYDRQHLNPESPYKFPPHLAPHVHGGLTYPDMVEAYKAHPIHINVNSVEHSGTMFSRRVFEICASGGAIISGPGDGLEQMFGGTIPVITDQDEAEALIEYWMQNEQVRNHDAWLTHRSVLRSHTAAHRLAYILRTAGLTVKAPSLERYAVIVDELTQEAAEFLEHQSVPPSRVLLKRAGKSDEVLTNLVLSTYGPECLSELQEDGITLIGRYGQECADRTFFEDLLASRKYCKWEKARINGETLQPGESLARLHCETAESASADLRQLDASDDAPTLILRRAVLKPAPQPTTIVAARARRVLVAGHDLKFAGGIIAALRGDGHQVSVDQWDGHSGHDERRSVELLAEADVVFCEWTLGNAVWFARNKRPGQRLVSRLHLQELDTKYLQELDLAAVDKLIFVGRHIADRAERDFRVPPEKVAVIPNYVDVTAFSQPKSVDAQWTLGLVGMVPQRKRLDLALDTLSSLRAEDARYRLRIKGKRAEQYPWMADRPDELEYYLDQYRRIETDPMLRGAVSFDPHGSDMPEWYSGIGTVLSVSDFESFHLTLADGAASAALPLSLAWAGADQIYPTWWLCADVPELVARIRSSTLEENVWKEQAAAARTYVVDNFGRDLVLSKIKETILGQD